MERFKLPRGAKAAIRRWLALPSGDKPDICPFTEIACADRCGDICTKMFPITKRISGCPCHVCTLSYVIRRAKKVVGK